MMPRIHIVLARADDPGQSRVWIHPNAVYPRMLTRLRVARFHPMHIHARQMLDQRAFVKHVEQLHAPADGQHREIGRQSFLKQSHFKLVARVVWRFALGGALLAIAHRIDIAATREQKPIQPFERCWIRHSFDARFPQCRLVRRGFGRIPESDACPQIAHLYLKLNNCRSRTSYIQELH